MGQNKTQGVGRDTDDHNVPLLLQKSVMPSFVAGSFHGGLAFFGLKICAHAFAIAVFAIMVVPVGVGRVFRKFFGRLNSSALRTSLSHKRLLCLLNLQSISSLSTG